MASVVRSVVTGSIRQVHATLDLPASYATGGVDLSPADVGLNQIYGVVGSAKGYVLFYDSGKVLVYRQSEATGALAEVANATDISAGGPASLVVLGI